MGRNYRAVRVVFLALLVILDFAQAHSASTFNITQGVHGLVQSREIAWYFVSQFSKSTE